MFGDSAIEDWGQSAGELANVRAAVAVRGDDEHAPWEVGGGAFGETQNHVVMELALGPVRDELVAAVAGGQVFEEHTEDQLAGETADGRGHPVSA